MTIKSYWDLNRVERGLLSNKEFCKYTDIYLMSLGFVRPAPVEVPKTLPDIKPENRVYVVKFGAWHSIATVDGYDDAQRLAKLAECFLNIKSEAIGGKTIRFAEDQETNISIEIDYINSRQEALTLKSLEQDQKEILEQFKHHKSAMEEINKATADMREDYTAARGEIWIYKELIRTWNTYFGLSNGDESIAASFYYEYLLKNEHVEKLINSYALAILDVVTMAFIYFESDLQKVPLELMKLFCPQAPTMVIEQAPTMVIEQAP